MREQLENRNLTEVRPLVTPRDVKERQPTPPEVGEHVLRARRALREVIHGRDADRLVVIAGPCSLHDEEAALEYARRLAPVAASTADALLVVMRTYFEKPRTTVGWKGLINDPHLDGSCDIATGLGRARGLLLRINALGLPCGTEFLDPVTPQYIGDLVSWSAVGARTTESQTHREMASGLSMPVGFKNGTDGTLEGAVNAMVSAGHPHRFLGVDAEGRTAVVATRGNADRHLVLRGGTGGPNCDPDTVARAAALTAAESAPRGVMIDCSHANSGKDPSRQGAVCRDALTQVRAGQRAIMGLMLESHLEPGRQDWSPDRPLRFGVSITDACIGWDETAGLLEEMAETVRMRRAA